MTGNGRGNIVASAMFGRKPSAATADAQKRQRLAPVQCWKQEWVTPKGALPGSTYKVLKWIKSDQILHFSDDDELIAQNPAAAVVDEEVEDANLASELPEVIADEGEGEEGDENADAENAAKLPDGVDPTSLATSKSPNAEDDDEDEVEKDAGPELSSSNPLVTAEAPAADDDADVLPLNADDMDMIMPTPASQIIPEPAPDGPSLDEITREQLMADAADFADVPASLVDADGILGDSVMDFALGDP